MHFSQRDVFGVRNLRKTGGLHKEHLEAVPELVGGKGGNAHEEEDTVKDGDGNHLEKVESKDTGQNQSVNQQMRQPRLNDLGDATLVVLVCHSLDMDHGRDGRGHKPRKADDTVDGDHKSNHQGIVVVGLAVLERERLIDQTEIGKIYENSTKQSENKSMVDA